MSRLIYLTKTTPIFVGISCCLFQLLLQLVCLLNAVEIKSIEGNGRKLMFVQAIWRHGDRALHAKPYEEALYDESTWSRGWGQLTKLGMQQMKKLGEFMHERYIGNGDEGKFLSKVYNRTELLIRSSHIDRANESAQMLLRGMFPPDADGKSQPIPVLTNPRNVPDPLLLQTSFFSLCPRYQQIKKKEMAIIEQRMWQQYPDLVDAMRFILHIPDDQPVPLKKVTELNELQIEVKHNLAQPNWVNHRWQEYGNKSTLEVIKELRAEERIAQFKANDEMRRLSGGFLLGDWLKRAQELANGNYHRDQFVHGSVEKPLKMLLYSAHNSTLIALLAALHASEKVLKMHSHASSIIMEFYETTDMPGELFIQFLYRSNGQLVKFEVDGCAENGCPVSEWIATARNNVFTDRKTLEEACAAVPAQQPDSYCNQLVPVPQQAMERQIMACQLNTKCCWHTGPGKEMGCRTVKNVWTPRGKTRMADGKCKQEKEQEGKKNTLRLVSKSLYRKTN